MSSAEDFAEFLEKIGHRVKKIRSHYFYNKESGAYLSFPFHKSIDLSSSEEAQIFSDPRVAILRFTSSSKDLGISSNRVSCRDQNYDLKSLASKSRNQTRRGLENCTVERMSPLEVSTPGLQLFESTLKRQNRPIPRNFKKNWTKYCQAADCTNGFKCWGAYIDNQLCSYMIGFEIDGCFNFLRNASNSAFLSAYPNNALVFTATQQMLDKSGISEVSYGLAPLDNELPMLDKFKKGMGYQEIPIQQRLVLSPKYRKMAKLSNLVARPILNNLTENPKIKRVVSFVEQAD